MKLNGKSLSRWLNAGVGAGLLVMTLPCCMGATLGRPLAVDPKRSVKIGLHQREDIERLLGPPYRVTVDSRGREILTYVYADGQGGGTKCIIALNENSVAYVVECVP